MQIFKEIEPLRAFLVEKRKAGQSIGFVPTMGALHAGHLSLLATSRDQNPLTVCSIFVNPTQFNNVQDFENYPRTLKKDVAMLEKAGCDVLFCPDELAMRSRSGYLHFNFGHLETVMEGKFRPGHFNGVAQVVSKLFHIVDPDHAYFGQKDWQQFVIIRTLVDEIKFNVKLHSVETVRENNGLAMSSRNLRLSEAQRKQAVLLPATLAEARMKLNTGDSIASVKKFVEETFESNAAITLEYVEVVNSENLLPLDSVEEADRPILCIAAFVGEVRLIDNLFL
jgi:pantoate--beta-alanine ligase